MEYFNHDTTAGGDDKIIALRLEDGGAAVDAFWCILEQIYRDETALDIFGNQHVLRSVSHRLAVDSETLKKWISTMLEIGLLETDENDPNKITSARAMSNINAYKAKSETARQNGKKGGRKPKEKANANQSGNRTLTDAKTQGKANKNKIKDIGLHKVNLISVGENGASAANAAPFSQPLCPFCSGKLFKNSQTGKWSCGNCCETFDADKVCA